MRKPFAWISGIAAAAAVRARSNALLQPPEEADSWVGVLFGLLPWLSALIVGGAIFFLVLALTAPRRAE